MSAQTIWVKAGELTAAHVGRGIWCRIRHAPREQWERRDGDWDESTQYVWGWARITMVTHTSKGVTKVRIRGGGLVDWGYDTHQRINVTTEEYTL